MNGSDTADTLHRIYERQAQVIENHLNLLPVGSYFQRLKNGYSVKVWRPLSKGSWLTFSDDSLAAAMEAAVDYVIKEASCEK